MWIEELPNGKYKYFERYKDPLTEKWKKVSVTLDKKTAQAQKQAITLLMDKIEQKEQKQKLSDITFGDLIQEFEKSWSLGVKETSIRAHKTHINKLLEYIPKGTLIRNINRKLLQNCLDDIQSKGYSRSYTSNTKVKLGQLLDYAIRMEYLEINPITAVKLARAKQNIEQLNKLSDKYLNLEEFQTLSDVLAASKTAEKYLYLITILFWTGMRIGELAGINMNTDIDFDNKTIAINHGYDFVKQKRIPPKTAKSIRTISAPTAVFDAIKELQRIHRLTGYRGDYLFVADTGKPIRVEVVIKTLKRYAKIAGIEKNVTTHIFRHSHISFLAENGIPLPAIMDRVGHSDSKITLEIYSHVTKNMSETIATKLERFAPSLPLSANKKLG